MKRRIIVLFLAVAMMVCIAGCGEEDQNISNNATIMEDADEDESETVEEPEEESIDESMEESVEENDLEQSQTKSWIDDLYDNLIEFDLNAVLDVLADPELRDKVTPYLYPEAEIEGFQKGYVLVTTDEKELGLLIYEWGGDDVTNMHLFCSIDSEPDFNNLNYENVDRSVIYTLFSDGTETIYYYDGNTVGQDRPIDYSSLPADRAWIDDAYEKLMAFDVDAVIEILQDPELEEKAEPYLEPEASVLENQNKYLLPTTDGKLVGLLIEDYGEGAGVAYLFYSYGAGHGLSFIAYGDKLIGYMIDQNGKMYLDTFDGKTIVREYENLVMDLEPDEGWGKW